MTKVAKLNGSNILLLQGPIGFFLRNWIVNLEKNVQKLIELV